MVKANLFFVDHEDIRVYEGPIEFDYLPRIGESIILFPAQLEAMGLWDHFKHQTTTVVVYEVEYQMDNFKITKPVISVRPQ